MINLIKDTSGSYHAIAQIRDLYIDNNSPTDWYVAIRMADTTLFAVADGFTTQMQADDAMREIVEAIGYLDPPTVI